MDTVTIKIIVPTPKGKEMNFEVECDAKFEIGTYAIKVHLPEQYFYFWDDKMIWSEFDVKKRNLGEI